METVRCGVGDRGATSRRRTCCRRRCRSAIAMAAPWGREADLVMYLIAVAVDGAVTPAHEGAPPVDAGTAHLEVTTHHVGAHLGAGHAGRFRIAQPRPAQMQMGDAVGEQRWLVRLH